MTAKRICRLCCLGLVLLTACAENVFPAQFLLQVEDFDGPWRRQANIAGFLGQGFCTSNANPKVAETNLRKSIQIDQPADYAVWVRAYTSPNSRRALRVEVGGKLLAVTHQGKQQKWGWEKAGVVKLDAGKTEVVVHDAADGFESADAVLLTSDPEDDPRAEEQQWFVYRGALPKQVDALRFNIDACLALSRTWQDPKSKEAWEARREQVARKLRQAMALEPWPRKMPLEARVTGRAEREGYTIENVVFQSLPRFYVTANVYKPKNAKEPLPAVVVTAGHAMAEGKNYDLYRTAQLGLVRQGFLVLAYDPLGQGERREKGYSHSVSYPALLVGHSNLRYMVWDSIRALDYLMERDDVDPERIGLAGNSGGGLNVMYTMPVEPRFAAGASFCCLCSFEAWIGRGGNHCICNHLPGICREMEQFEFVGFCSPRPFMAGNGQKDPIFPIDGVRDTIRRARKIYEFHGASDRLKLAEAPLPHGWSQPLREAAYGWFGCWLADKPDTAPIPEEKISLEDWKSKDLRCFKEGKLPEDAKSYVDLIREEAARLIATYPPIPAEDAARAKWSRSMRERLWRTMGGQPAPSSPTAKVLGSFEHHGHTVEQLAIATEPGMEVPALLLRANSADDTAPAVILLDDGGKHLARTSGLVASLLRKGIHVLALDPRATGESEVLLNQCASDAVVLGRPLLAQQAWDVIAAARWLAARANVDSKRIAVCGQGKIGLIGLLAGALTDDLAATVTAGSLESFVDAIDDPLPQSLWVYAANILKVADAPQLAAMHAPKPILRLDGPLAQPPEATLSFFQKVFQIR